MTFKKIVLLALIFSCHLTYAQDLLPNKTLDGMYTALIDEKGPKGPTKDKVIQLVENNGTTMLAVAACEKCFPALYTYNSELSEQFGSTVFMNSFGIFVLRYDSNSFVVVAPSLQMDENFSFQNFYSKAKAKTSSMSKEKIEEFALPLLDLI